MKLILWKKKIKLLCCIRIVLLSNKNKKNVSREIKRNHKTQLDIILISIFVNSSISSILLYCVRKKNIVSTRRLSPVFMAHIFQIFSQFKRVVFVIKKFPLISCTLHKNPYHHLFWACIISQPYLSIFCHQPSKKKIVYHLNSHSISFNSYSSCASSYP